MDPARLDDPVPDYTTPFDDSGLLPSTRVVWRRRPKFQDRRWLHGLLLLLTFASTTLAGAGHYTSFATDLLQRPLTLSSVSLFLHGLWYSVTILAILGCHELGHYLACRYYDVDASLPFFLPMPFLLTGTMGAFIRIREPIPSKRMLFDIGIAGPIAGFLVTVPAVLIGVAMSRVIPEVSQFPPGVIGYQFGDPLLMKVAEWVIWGPVPDGYTFNLHPIGFAGWFGMLATALNLFPIGQLDGGHISYAVLGRRSTIVTLTAIATALGLGYFVASSWFAWTILMVLLLLVFGRSLRHPRTIDEHIPLDRRRLLLALFAVVMFVACFTPSPIEQMDLIRP